MAGWSAGDYHWDPQALVAIPAVETGTPGNPSPEEPVWGVSSRLSPFEQPTDGHADLSGTSGSPKVNGKAKKRGKAPRRRAPSSVCQVVGCGTFIQGGKSFFRLQRICEAHARAMAVTDASGHMLRFCQQCTRMHPLSEFQDAKRSCIASLKRRAQRKAALRDERRQEPATAAAVQGPGSHSGTQSKASLPDKASLPSAAADSYGSQQPSCAMVASAGAVSSDSGTPGSDFLSPLGGGSFHTDGSGSGTLGGSSGGQLPLNPLLLQELPSELVHQQQLYEQPHAHLLTAQQQQAHLFAPQHSAASSQLLGSDWLTQHDLLAPANHSGILSPQHSLRQHGQLLRPAGAASGVFPHQCSPLSAPLGVPLPLGTAGSAAYVGLTGVESSSLPALPHANAHQEHRRLSELPTISAAELDMLLALDPDSLADSLLARTAASSSVESAGSLSDSLRRPSPGNAFVSSGGFLRRDLLGVGRSEAQAVPGTAVTASGYGSVPTQSAVPRPIARLSPTSAAPQLAAWPAARAAVAALHAVASITPGGVLTEFVVVRLSLKMYGLYPDQLPPNVRADLQRCLLDSPTVLTGAVRSGCTHLTVNLLATSAEAAALQQPSGAAAALAGLLQAWQQPSEGQQAWQLPAGLPLLKVVADVENGGAAALLCPVVHRRLQPESAAVYAISADSVAAAQQRLQLSLAPTTPAITTVGACSGRFELHCSEAGHLLAGEPSGSSQRTLHCRSRGMHIPVALLQPRSSGAGSAEDVRAAAAVQGDGSSWDTSGSDEEEQQQQQGEQEEEQARQKEEAEQQEEEAEQALRLLLQQVDAAEACVPAAQAHAGLYEFELATGPWMGISVPVLVLPAELGAAAVELQSLAAAPQAAVQPDLLRLVSLVLEHQESQQQVATAAATCSAADAAALQDRHAAAYPPSGVARLAAAARTLCALCVRRQCPALLRLLLPTAIAGDDTAAAAAAMDAQLAPLGLLGTAAATGNAGLLWALADVAPAAAGHSWQQACGSSGLTPLHLAAALGPQLTDEAAAALVAASGGQASAARSWCTAQAEGWTARQVATAARCSALLGQLGSTAAAAGEEGTSPSSATDEGPGTSGGDPLKPCKQQPLLQPGAGADDAASAGAAAQEPLLLWQQLEWDDGAEDVKKSGDGYFAGSTGLEPTPGRLPVTAAELEAWRRRPMHPGVLVLVGGGAILVALGLVMALKAGLYD